VTSFPVKSGVIAAAASTMKHDGKGTHERQDKPHAHSIYAGPKNDFVYAPDLGIDQVMIYGFDAAGKLTKSGSATVPAGSGPRHMRFGKDGSFAYVLNELTLTISVFSASASGGGLVMLETVSVLPEGANSDGMTCSEILVSSDGKFVYAAIRDLNDATAQDSLTVMAVEADGGVKHVETTLAKVRIPRHINLSVSGDWLLVAGQKEGKVASHKVDKASGKLTYNTTLENISAAMCITPAPV
jgi:6-phosphogluconolactonase